MPDAEAITDRVLHHVHTEHARCSPPCALTRMWREDVQEVLAAGLRTMADTTGIGAAWTAHDLRQLADSLHRED